MSKHEQQGTMLMVNFFVFTFLLETEIKKKQTQVINAFANLVFSIISIL